MELSRQLKEDFSNYSGQAEKDSFFSIRERAYKEFEKSGIPTIRNEEWKYTSLKPIEEQKFVPSCITVSDVTGILEAHALTALIANKLVFVNGCYREDLSVFIDQGEGAIISTLSDAKKHHAEILLNHFGKYAEVEGQGLNAMNTAMLSDGAFVNVKSKTALQHPIMIIHVSDSAEVNVLNQPRNLVVMEANSSAEVIELYLSTGVNPAFTNVVSEIYVGEQANINVVKIQAEEGENYQNNFTQFFQEKGSNATHTSITLDGLLVRNNLHFYLNGENCESSLFGLYITKGKAHVDNHTRVDHAKPHCNSNELYKGVLADNSTAVFNGKIIVHENAQKTSAYQRNQNILLSDTATVNTKPQLEIFADDVKCTHGATVGQLNEEPVFYLRSRGIPESEARRMLLQAFTNDLTDKISNRVLADLLTEEISRRL